jgi:hypothetical protein
VAKVLYKPFGMLVGALGGVAAGFAFKKLWSLVSKEEAPSPTQADRSWGAILAAAAAEGAIYALVRAVVTRSTAVAIEQATGEWPGEGERS